MNKDRRAAVILPCADIDASLEFFTELGFCLEMIYPADAPQVAELRGAGLRIRLDAKVTGDPGTLHLSGFEENMATVSIAPNGTRLQWDDRPGDPTPTPPMLAEPLICRAEDELTWSQGRAGMKYRDLIPGRLDGFAIASHIRIPDGGPVADYVHWHAVEFQLIYCVRGWVRVVYEDQGKPFVLHPGDAVLQPPGIRHRVLESSPGLEVIEVVVPASHVTHVDPSMQLPGSTLRPDRRFAGQRFLHHRADQALWRKLSQAVTSADLGVGDATLGRAGAREYQLSSRGTDTIALQGPKLAWWFILEGSITARSEQERYDFNAQDAIAWPCPDAIEITAREPARWLIVEVY